MLTEVNWTAYMREFITANNYINLEDVSRERFGDAAPDHVRKMYNILFLLKDELSTGRGMRWVRNGNIVTFEPVGVSHDADEPTRTPERPHLPMPEASMRRAPKVMKPKTLVIVGKETADGSTVEVLGDSSRNLMKEIIKQLMEAII